MTNRVYVVGMGPGDAGDMSREAAETLAGCDTIIGYTVYVDLLRDLYPDKEFLSTPMTRESERCELAFKKAEEGRKVAMVCSGDAGVYGMSGLMLQIGVSHPDVELKVIPGITAALSGGALLGAPLTNDFAVVSLSDRLTKWEKIEKRLRLAAEADFVICIYNPASKSRPDTLKRACEILLELLPPGRLCGIAGKIGREGQNTRLLSLSELADVEADMFMTVFIGNSMTEEINGQMVTLRGYQLQ